MDEPIVEFTDGKVKGIYRENLDGEKYCAYLGIPYGKPPIGEKRFKAPEPTDGWKGVKDCTKDGEKNIQIQPLICLDVEGSEDCLHLNVYTKKFPGDTSKPIPVMVYLFGGRFRSGSSRSDLFGPDYLLSENMVLVVPNCRVGLLGFLSLEDPTLDVPGNASLKDQNLALRWVQKNIIYFGGDPNNVTLVGHSSGGSAVHYHLLSPCSEGLFHKAVVMSGSAFLTWIDTEQFSLEKLAKAYKINAESERAILEHFQSLSAKEFIETQENYFNMLSNMNLVIGPVVEKPNRTAFITKDPTDIVLNGEFMKVPLLVTYTSHEALMYEMINRNTLKAGGEVNEISLEPEEFIPVVFKDKIDNESFKKVCSSMKNVYKSYNNLEDGKLAIMSDFHFVAGIMATAKTHAELSDKPVYLLRWSMDDELNFMKLACDGMDLPGTSHADELGYIFSRTLVPRPPKGSKQEKVINKTVHLIRNFCNSGNPSLCPNSLVSKWQPLQINKTQIIDFGDEITMKSIPELQRMQAWQKILEFDTRCGKLSHLIVV